MQKALNELENNGLIRTERTNGKYVSDDKKLSNMQIITQYDFRGCGDTMDTQEESLGKVVSILFFCPHLP